MRALRILTISMIVAAIAALGLPRFLAHTSAAPATVATEAAPSQSAEPTASAEPAEPEAACALCQGAKGPQVTEVQTQLQRLGYFRQQPTGYYGPVTTAAVSAFQTATQLPATGQVDAATRAALKQAAAAAPSAAPSSKAPTSPKPSPKASPKTSKTALDPRCLTGRVICVDQTAHRLYWVIDGAVQDDFSIRTGRPSLPTRNGTFSVYLKQERSWSKLYNVWLPYAMYFSGGQAVHYSEEFAKNGYGVGSHGCVNMRDYDGIVWLYSQVRVGDTVVVY